MRPASPAPAEALPIPPIEMRQLVGPTDPADYDNPTRSLVFPYLPARAFESVFDFGCGCGRVARQLIQQEPRPVRYLGIDLHRGMIEWCRVNLAPHAPDFAFLHHDVFNMFFNPGKKPAVRAFAAEDGAFTLVNATSVFTHLPQGHAEHYLHEARRVLTPDGILHASWFLFDRVDFPMLTRNAHALYASDVDPTAAVLFSREWLRECARAAGFTIYDVIAPPIRGYQWLVLMTPTRPGVEEVELPPDEAPRGTIDLPDMPENPSRIGLD